MFSDQRLVGGIGVFQHNRLATAIGNAKIIGIWHSGSFMGNRVVGQVAATEAAKSNWAA